MMAGYDHGPYGLHMQWSFCKSEVDMTPEGSLSTFARHMLVIPTLIIYRVFSSRDHLRVFHLGLLSDNAF